MLIYRIVSVMLKPAPMIPNGFLSEPMKKESSRHLANRDLPGKWVTNIHTQKGAAKTVLCVKDQHVVFVISAVVWYTAAGVLLMCR